MGRQRARCGHYYQTRLPHVGPPIHWVGSFQPLAHLGQYDREEEDEGAARVPDGTKAPSLPFSAGSCAEAEEKKERRREEARRRDCGDLWDDSALVNAFDRAVSTFKAMHGNNTQAASCESEKTDPPAEPVSAEATNEKKDNSIDIPCGSVETLKQPSEESKTIDQTPLQETDSGKEIHVSESKTLSSDFTDAGNNISSAQQGGLNELLRRYYELEEQSQNVLQQLQQTNYWDSQAPYYAPTYQQPPVPAYSPAAQDPHSSTPQSSCCYWNCPTVSISCCSASQPSGNSVSMSPYGDQCPGASTTYPTGANFMQPPAKLSTNDDQVTKAAMMTAEGAFNFMRSTISGEASSQRKESETGKEITNIGVHPNFNIVGADSDLAVVFNAWFTAGFHTGRYLERWQQQQQPNKNS